jgi:tRNA (cytidine/uridine-2'-O-)-methyltransferase
VIESSLLKVALVEPEIPANTGNVGRTCLSLGAELHLIGRLGFSLSDKDLQRAGMDYWPQVKLTRHVTWDDFECGLPPGTRLHFFSTKGTKAHWDASYEPGDVLVFGKESSGLPPSFYERYKDHLVTIPQPGVGARSLNLSVSVGVGLYEAYRQIQSKGGLRS